MVIVYRSNTGFTREYAQMLAKAEKMKAYDMAQEEDQVPSDQEVLFMGPLMAGHITGLDRAMKRFRVAGVCGVGMSPAGQTIMDAMAQANYTKGAPLFYLQGGWDPRKVSWLKRKMVQRAVRSTREQLRDKGGSRTPREEAHYEMLVHGGSFVAFESLGQIRSWLKSR